MSTPSRLSAPTLKPPRGPRWLHRQIVRRGSANPLRLTQRNVYILPARVGAMLAVTLAALLVASINYQINLGYLFVFVLASCALSSVWLTHRTLRGLELRLAGIDPVFAGEAMGIRVTVGHDGRSTRHSLGLMLGSQKTPQTVIDIPPGERQASTLVAPALRRGLFPCPALAVETRYPLGMFRAWSIWRPPGHFWVYPQAEVDAPPLPTPAPSNEAGPQRAHGTGDDNSGIRTYRAGDPLKTILWKKTATAIATGHGTWLRREPQAAAAAGLWLDYGLTGLADRPEAALSRLCAWLLQAEAGGQTYGLRLPGITIAPDAGEAHLHECLRALSRHPS